MEGLKNYQITHTVLLPTAMIGYWEINALPAGNQPEIYGISWLPSVTKYFKTAQENYTTLDHYQVIKSKEQSSTHTNNLFLPHINCPYFLVFACGGNKTSISIPWNAVNDIWQLNYFGSLSSFQIPDNNQRVIAGTKKDIRCHRMPQNYVDFSLMDTL